MANFGCGATIAARCDARLGVIERCLDEATRFAIERQQFGHPIASYQLTIAKNHLRDHGFSVGLRRGYGE